MQDTTAVSKKVNLKRVIAFSIGALLVPLLASRFSQEMTWSFIDYIVAGVLFFCSAFSFEFFIARANSARYKVASVLTVLTAFLLIWINLAVGVLGSEDNRANLLYLAVIAVLCSGAALCRLQAQGMARTLFATAIAHLLIAVIALAMGFSNSLPFNLAFVGLWIISGVLFKSR